MGLDQARSTVVIIVGAVLVALIVIVVVIVMVRARRRKALQPPQAQPEAASERRSSRTNIYDGIIPNLGPPREAALNRPGHWHMMISYTQRSDRAQVLAHELRTSLQAMGFTVWLDIDMEDKSEAAMKEAVEHSRVLVAVVTGQGPNDENAYLNRAFCQNELRWAAAAKTHVRPVVHVNDKTRIGEFISMAPEDLKWLGTVDFVDVRTEGHSNRTHVRRTLTRAQSPFALATQLNLSDREYWEVGLKKMLKKATAALQPVWRSGDTAVEC